MRKITANGPLYTTLLTTATLGSATLCSSGRLTTTSFEKLGPPRTSLPSTFARVVTARKRSNTFGEPAKMAI